MATPENLVKTYDQPKDVLEQKIKETQGLVVVDFGAPWCPDCRRLEAGLPKLAAANPDVLFLCINVDKVTDARQEFNIQHIPDVRFYRGNLNHMGQIVEGSAAQVQEQINKLK